MMGVRDLPHCVIIFLISSPFLFFLLFVLFVCPFHFVIIWWVWETCYTVEYDWCERPVISFGSFYDVESFLFFFILYMYMYMYMQMYMYTYSQTKFTNNSWNIKSHPGVNNIFSLKLEARSVYLKKIISCSQVTSIQNKILN